MLSRRTFFSSLPILRLAANGASPALKFAALADIQFADQPTTGKRAYRDSLGKLADAARHLAPEHPAFTIQLGDLVDNGIAAFDRIQPAFAQLPAPRHHVLGNHDFFAPRGTVLHRFGLAAPYYSFRQKPWHFVVLDGMNVSVKGGWDHDAPGYTAGAALLADLRRRGASSAQDWNGAVGPRQRAWLQRELQLAARRGERSIVFCHFPTLAAACRPDHLLWDHADVLAVLEAAPSVAAWINGHDHNGGYALHAGIHHVTLPAVVEHDVAGSLRIFELHTDHLLLRRPGESAGQALALHHRAS